MCVQREVFRYLSFLSGLSAQLSMAYASGTHQTTGLDWLLCQLSDEKCHGCPYAPADVEWIGIMWLYLSLKVLKAAYHRAPMRRAPFCFPPQWLYCCREMGSPPLCWKTGAARHISSSVFTTWVPCEPQGQVVWQKLKLFGQILTF